MDSLNWRMVSVAFQVFQFVFMAVIFLIIKLNDFKHVEGKISKLNDDMIKNQKTQNQHHTDNLKAINKLAEKINTLYGRCNAIHNIKEK